MGVPEPDIRGRLTQQLEKVRSEFPLNPMTYATAIGRIVGSSLDNAQKTNSVAFYQKVADMLVFLLQMDSKYPQYESVPPVPTTPGGYATISESSYYDKLYFWANKNNVLPHLYVVFLVAVDGDGPLQPIASDQPSLFPQKRLGTITQDHPLKRFLVARRELGVGDTNYFGITENMNGDYTYDLEGRDLVVCEGRKVQVNFVNAGEIEIQQGAMIIGNVQARSLIKNGGSFFGTFFNI